MIQYRSVAYRLYLGHYTYLEVRIQDSSRFGFEASYDILDCGRNSLCTGFIEVFDNISTGKGMGQAYSEHKENGSLEKHPNVFQRDS
jgi:hypothetical protein